ncbi:MAG: pilus assembly protein TadG-related protein [Hyphomicrobiales bacterium]
MVFDFMRFLRAFLKDSSGSLTIIMSVGIVILIGALGGAADIAALHQQKSSLQGAADAAALASANELGLASTNKDDIKAIAKQYVSANFRDADMITAGGPTTLEIDVEVDLDAKWVTVDVAYEWTPFFAHLISDNVTPVMASSTASLAGNQSICVIALDRKNDGSLLMSGTSTIMANDCGVYANSISTVGLNLQDPDAFLEAASTFTSGGFAGFEDNFKPMPVTDSPPIDDPLINREYPEIDGCIPENTNIFLSTGEAKQDPRYQGGVLTFTPGTYCDGLRVIGKLEVKFEPGIYVFKDGPIEITGNATIIGENVGMFFTGDTSTFSFTGSSQVSLTAPDEGPMAGLLFFEDRNSPLNRSFRIETKDAERFEGTVYLPRGKFIIDKASRLGQQSNWTAIISHQIETGDGPELEINADFNASTIPVPEGLVPASRQPILISRKGI